MNLCGAQWLAYVLLCRRFAAALAGDSARLEVDVDRSGRTEARTGLRMMPTSPRSPPIIPYGGFSPVRLEGWPFRRSLPNTSGKFASILRAPRHLSNGTALSRACGLDCAPPLGGVSTTPGALARVRVVVSRSVIT